MSAADSDHDLPTPSESDTPRPLPSTVTVAKPVAGVRYQILRPHDKGGIGEVFVALDQELNRQVALKEIQERHAADPHTCGRFVREAEITGGLEHPGIVPVYGLGQYADGRPFYAMRFIQGETLKDAISRYHRTSADGSGARSPEFELRALLTRFVAVCNTIAYAHSRGVIHRDIKPSNIMLGKYGETLVVDWGMAKSGTNKPAQNASEGLPEPTIVPSLADVTETQAGSAMGTPAYMSPEQASGLLELIGPASDIYSLGATLYTLLTSRPPIEGKDTAEMLRKAQRGEWLPPRQVKPDVPPSLDAVCRKAMAPLPSARYATALELAADVERWLADEPLAVYRESWTARSRRWMRRHRTLVSTAVSALVIALLGTTIGLVVISDAWDKEAAARQTAESEKEEARKRKEEAEKQKEEAEKQKKEADRRREEARFKEYVASMNLVQREYEANNIGHVRELLEAQVPQEASEKDFRNFEWHYWQRMAHRELLTLEENEGGYFYEAMGVSFSPDGRRLTSVSASGRIRVWDAASLQELLTQRADQGLIRCVSFSPDGRLLALVGHNGTVRVRDATTGKKLASLEGARRVFSLSFSPDGRQLATAGMDGTVRVWDTATGRELRTLTGHNGYFLSLSFSPDGHRLASGCWDGTVHIFDAATGKVLLTLKGYKGAGRSVGFAMSISFTPDGRRLATASLDKTVRIWDAGTGRELFVLQGHTFSGDGVWFNGVSFSSDGKRLASACSDHTVRIWDTATRKELLILKGHTSKVNSMSFSPDGRRLASAGDDMTVRVWDAANGQKQLTLKGRASGVSFSPDGHRLASGCWDRTVLVWDTATGKVLLTLKGHKEPVMGVSFTPDGRWLASSSRNTVRVWNVATGKELLTLKELERSDFGDVSVSFSPDGQRLASLDSGGTVPVWDATTGEKLYTLNSHTGSLRGLCFSKDGQLIASTSMGAVHVWDTRTGKEQPTPLELTQRASGKGKVQFTSICGGPSFDPDGQRIAFAVNQTVRVWETATGKELLNLKGHLEKVSSVSFSPDGRRLASASDDHTVRVWDADTGHELLTLKGHTGRVFDVSFSPDGRRLASAGADGTVRIWEATSVGDEVWRKRWLVSHTASLFEELGLRDDVLAVLRTDPTLSEADRKFAFQVAQSRSESSKQLNETAWKVVMYRDAGKDAYTRALRKAEAAFRLEPDDGLILNTLGVALYRMGRYADALTTLTKSEKLNATKEGPHPTDLAFLAMTQHQLGDKDEAKATLGRMREIMKQPRWAQDAESVRFLREAEELIEGKAAGKG